MEGKDLRVHIRLWQDVAISEEKIGLMGELLRIGVGFPDMEEFHLGLEDKLRGEKMKGRKNEITRKLIDAAMRIKIKDEE